MKKLILLLVVFLFPLFALTGATEEVPEDFVTALPCYSMDQQACTAFHLTNQERIRNKRPPMKFCERCFQMAQEQSDDMYSRRYFSHDRPRFGDRRAESFSQRSDRFGLVWVGENIAMNPSVNNAISRLMKSPGHRKNILNPKYDSFAVGHRNGLYTQVFYRSQR